MITGQAEHQAYLKEAKKMRADMEAHGFEIPTNFSQAVDVATVLQLNAEGMDTLLKIMGLK